MVVGPRQGRVLIAIDNDVLSRFTSFSLRHTDLTVVIARTPNEAIAHVQHADVAIVDLDAPCESVLDRRAATGPLSGQPPVIALAHERAVRVLASVADRGADDVLVVPFDVSDLIVKVLFQMRRARQVRVSVTSRLRVGRIEVDLDSGRVQVGEHRAQLTRLEQRLLYLLLANAGHAVSRERIVDYVWGTEHVANSNVVDRHMRNLRSKLDDRWSEPRIIATVPGYGYRALTESPEAPPDPGGRRGPTLARQLPMHRSP